MHFGRVLASVVVILGVASIARPAQAAFHFFYIQEIYSNSDGSVQFIELFTTQSGQQFVKSNNQNIKSNTNTFAFPTDTPAPTNNHQVLLATAGFGSIAGGATPDYTIPAHFFNPAGDTINFASGVDTDTFASAPTDGSMSLNYTSAVSSATIAVNSPRNYAGSGGSVNLPPPVIPTGDYNSNHLVDAADYVLWRDTFGQTVTPGTAADGNSSGTIDNGDYTFWASKFGNPVPGAGSAAGHAGAVPEPAAMVLAAAGLLLVAVRCYARKNST